MGGAYFIYCVWCVRVFRDLKNILHIYNIKIKIYVRIYQDIILHASFFLSLYIMFLHILFHLITTFFRRKKNGNVK